MAEFCRNQSFEAQPRSEESQLSKINFYSTQEMISGFLSLVGVLGVLVPWTLPSGSSPSMLDGAGRVAGLFRERGAHAFEDLPELSCYRRYSSYTWRKSGRHVKRNVFLLNSPRQAYPTQRTIST